MKQKKLDMLLFEYAIIRFVPRVEREEFINIGLILFCKEKKYIKTRFFVNEEKFKLFKTEVDLEDLLKHINSFNRISEGIPKSGPIAIMPVDERFRWITAVKSSSIQVSRPHPGMTCNLEETFECLFGDLVL